ncbi:MAG: hypothetical protein U0441_30475 [Polyangiaceae bacterium]
MNASRLRPTPLTNPRAPSLALTAGARRPAIALATIARRPVLAFAASAAVAFFSACAPDETVHPVETSPSYAGKLDLEIRGAADVTIAGATPPETKMTIVVTGASAPHLLDDGTKLEAPARIEPFPEAGLELHVAKLTLPPDPEGPCDMKPRAVAISLSRRTSGERTAGAITVYCGDAFSGVPARVFRLTGALQRSK